MTDSVAAGRALEALVLWHFCDAHPASLQMRDVLRELDRDRSTPLALSDISRAVRSLVHVGLLRDNGAAFVPTASALRCHELWTYLP